MINRFLLHGLCAAWLIAMNGHPPGQAADNVRFYPEAVIIPERGEVTGYVLWLEDTRFSFLPPPTWHVKYDPERKVVTILAPNLEAGITCAITLQSSESKPDLDAKQLRETLLARYPDAKMIGCFKCYTSGNEGLAFDFERVVDKEVRAAHRLAFVAFRGGLVEFELNTSSAKFADCHHAFGNLLNSFRIEQREPRN